MRWEAWKKTPVIGADRYAQQQQAAKELGRAEVRREGCRLTTDRLRVRSEALKKTTITSAERDYA
jgi:hypothetical protein